MLCAKAAMTGTVQNVTSPEQVGRRQNMIALAKQQPNGFEDDLVGMLLQRRRVTGLQRRPADPVVAGSGTSSGKCAGLGYSAHSALQDLDDGEDGGMQQPASDPNIAAFQGPQPGNMWARRPVFAATARQVAYAPLPAETGKMCRDDWPRGSVAAYSDGGGGAQTRARRAGTPSERLQAGCSTDSELSGSTCSQSSDDSVPSPSSTGKGYYSSSSDSEEDREGAIQRPKRPATAVHRHALETMAQVRPCPPRKEFAPISTRPTTSLRGDVSKAPTPPMGIKVDDEQSTGGLEQPVVPRAELQPLRRRGSSATGVRGDSTFGLRSQGPPRQDGDSAVNAPPGATKPWLIAVSRRGADVAGPSADSSFPPAAAADSPDFTASLSFTACGAEQQGRSQQPGTYSDRERSRCDAPRVTVITGSRFYASRTQCALSPSFFLQSGRACMTGDTPDGEVHRQPLVVEGSTPAKICGISCPGNGYESCDHGQRQPKYKEAGGSFPDAHVHEWEATARPDVLLDTMQSEVDIAGMKALGQTGGAEGDFDSYNGDVDGDAEPDDAWWTEPIGGCGDSKDLDDVIPDRGRGAEAAEAQTLEIFLKQARRVCEFSGEESSKHNGRDKCA
ncbi:hypothetical protein VOLCADRAFT_99876 [Volvox carteri f. nagariensis]|uniref:Uncharacterized protein n=1 Tax=Volvox carteri f. nagariensis TaxID=3068 RepID=D8UIV4_VOLCA|nr:uncharacterized protein VOLCADRAFT_99876 [Volvox carteri f. nagariensis]EFJ40340.1 hypothetical protein VOLCADRAFT_99876 [Volvox carteri f. nagariensis]|eukprot:XP_002958603.1 hypothetical protein VOLCADRAFT_99876 [Volvox carteri f. nagariensis]